MVWEIDFYPKEDRLNIPDLPEEKALLNDWKLAKPLFEDLQNEKYHLIKIIVAFRRIKEYSRTIPREVCEEFTKCLKENGRSRTFKNDINLMFKMAELYQNLNKPIEAEKFYQKSLNLVLTEGYEVILNLKDYIRLMAHLKRSEKCYETIEKLTAKYESYRKFLALASMELKAFEKSLVILGKCPQESNTVIFSQIKALYELKMFDLALELCNKVTEEKTPDLNNYKKQLSSSKVRAKGLFWYGKIRFAQKKYINAWPALANMTWELQKIFRKKEQIDHPYPFKQIFVHLVPQALAMMEECLKQDYKAIKNKFYLINEEELEELAFNYASFAQQAQRDHMNLKALILVNFSKLLMMTCRVEPPQMCFNVWQYDCALDVKIRLGMLDEAIPEIHASRINQDKKLKEYGFDVEGLQMLMENRLFMLYTRLHYVEEADELFKNLKKSKDSNFANYDGLGFRHASTLYSAQRHSESIELFKKHKNFLKTNFKEGHTFLWRPAISYLHLGEYEKSMEALTNFMKMKGNASNCSFDVMLKAHILKGVLYRKKKEFKEAIYYFAGAKKIGDEIFAPFHKMLAAYDSSSTTTGKSSKNYTKFMRQMIQQCGSLNVLVSWLQCSISHEERYLDGEWRKILDIFVLRSRDIWPKPEKDFPRLRLYRTSSLLSLHFVQKRVQCLNEKY